MRERDVVRGVAVRRPGLPLVRVRHDDLDRHLDGGGLTRQTLRLLEDGLQVRGELEVGPGAEPDRRLLRVSERRLTPSPVERRSLALDIATAGAGLQLLRSSVHRILAVCHSEFPRYPAEFPLSEIIPLRRIKAVSV